MSRQRVRTMTTENGKGENLSGSDACCDRSGPAETNHTGSVILLPGSSNPLVYSSGMGGLYWSVSGSVIVL